jgi:hypothetical protein
MSAARNSRLVLALSILVIAAACSDAPPTGPAPVVAASGVAHDRLAALFLRTSPEVMALRGTVFADHDEVGNRLVFGVENALAGRAVRGTLARMGVSNADYVVESTEPIYQLATLRDRWRPTQAGIQIHFGQYVCTMGFNVDHAGGRSFITNSHCTNKQGGTEGTEYYQPTSTADPTVIGIEADDPTYFRGGVCPRGRQCRYSDAARVLYSSSVGSSRGVISRTTGENNGSLDVSGEFTITAQDNSTTRYSGTLHKVGRTTGWSSGSVSSTCATINVSGSNITQLCQTRVNGTVAGGDSGSPVFRITSGDNVTLVGILWGGSSTGSSFIFSPLKNIRDELGSMTATK